MPTEDEVERFEEEYTKAMESYQGAVSDKERDDALMIAHWALINLTDKIDDLRLELGVQP